MTTTDLQAPHLLALRDRDEAVRREAIEQCAEVAERWAKDAAEFRNEPRCQLQENVCRNLAITLRNMARRI